MNYTSIEQSRKLLEFGLNPDTADMFYDLVDDEDCIPIELRTPVVIPWIKVKEDPEITIDNLLPCWSTVSLLNLMPPYLFEFSRGIDLNIYKNLNDKKWIISYLPNNIESMQKDKFRKFCFGDTLMEAAYDMILWLLSEGYLK